jgi:hypothetical protein
LFHLSRAKVSTAALNFWQDGLGVSERFGREMTQRAQTVLSMQEACKVVRATIQRLQTEALLGEAPNPPDIIERLKSAHLLLVNKR